MRAEKRTVINLIGVALNISLLALSVYILLYRTPINGVSLISAVLCPVAMALRYRGIVIGRWLSLVNGIYLAAFFWTTLAFSVAWGLQPFASIDFWLDFSGSILSALLIAHSLLFS